MRLEVNAYGAPARQLSGLLVGERLEISGRVRARLADAPWLDQRHVVGRLDIREVHTRRSAAWPHSWANALRRTLHGGARSLGPERRGLFTGFVYGDDRDQPSIIADDFRGSGLGHLLAVSGSNVPFVSVLLAPILKRLALRVRFATLTAALAFFALVTRFEPSVLRAIVMASIAGLVAAMGRTVSTRRIIALTCTALVLVDPVIARSVGFQLSVLATAGIVELAPAIAARLPGPRWLALGASSPWPRSSQLLPVEVRSLWRHAVGRAARQHPRRPAAGPIMMWVITRWRDRWPRGRSGRADRAPSDARGSSGGCVRCAGRGARSVRELQAPIWSLLWRGLCIRLLRGRWVPAGDRCCDRRVGAAAVDVRDLAPVSTRWPQDHGVYADPWHDRAHDRRQRAALGRRSRPCVVTGVRRVDCSLRSMAVARAVRSCARFAGRLAIGEIWAPSQHQIRVRAHPSWVVSVRRIRDRVTSTSAPLATMPRVASVPTALRREQAL